MNKDTFLRFVRAAKIASETYPVRGVNTIFPYGVTIRNSLESRIISPLQKLGYQEVDLPQIMPVEYGSSLHPEGIFKVTNNGFTGVMAHGTEMQAANLVREYVHACDDLPLRVWTKLKTHRNEARRPLIKDMELRLIEFHSFFEDIESLCAEKHAIETSVQKSFEELGIPVAWIVESDATSKLFAYFKGLQSFGTVFTIISQGTKYTQRAGSKIRSNSNVLKTPYHLNFSFTGRLLAAFLTNHYDQYGFSFPADLAPTRLFYCRSAKESSVEQEMLRLVQEQGYTYSMQSIANNNRAFQTFIPTGIPYGVSFGSYDVKLRIRSDPHTVLWGNPSEIMQKISQAMPSREVARIPICDNVASLKEDSIFATPFYHKDLKRIGAFADGRYAYVMRKF